MDTNFEKYRINKSDWNFFDKLPKEEKILFLYDLICEEAYGLGSTESVELEPTSTEDGDVCVGEFDSVIDDFESKIEILAGSTIDMELDINMLILNNFIVFNSNNIDLIFGEVKNLFMSGNVLRRHKLTPKAEKVFKHQLHCVVYEILGKVPPLSEN
jgi:hypothetical protein